MDNEKIEKGININEQYQLDVLEQKNNIVPLVTQLKNIGFSDLQEFFDLKKEYLMHKYLKNNILETTSSNAMNTLQTLINNNQFGIVSVTNDITCVHVGKKENNLNQTYCSENNIPIFLYDSYGGAIVATKDDYSLAFIVPSNIDLKNSFILENIKLILEKYFSNVSIEGNDIFIDGLKVAGSTAYSNDKIFFMIFHFSMSDKKELILNICGAPKTGKQVGYINTNILNVNKLKEELLSWLQGL